MNRRAGFWWAAWAVGSLACIAVLAWISRTALDLQRGEAQARAETVAQQAAHDAAWSMDSWMALLLSRWWPDCQRGRPSRDTAIPASDDGVASATLPVVRFS